MPFDIDKPIPKADQTLADLLERIAETNEALLQVQRPGVLGIEGTEVVPELRIHTINVPPGDRFEIMGNRRRKRLSIAVSRCQTGGSDLETAFVDVTTRDSWEMPGYLLGYDDDMFLVNNSTNSVYLRAVDEDRTDASDPVTVTIIEESS